MHDAWLQWMLNQHLSDVMNTGCFVSYRLCKLLAENDTGTTYAVQYFCNSLEDFHSYEKTFAPALRAEGMQKFGEHMVAFRTLMEIIA